MSDDELDDELNRFLLRSVETYDELHTLLLVGGSGTTSWTAARVEERLRLPEVTAKAALEQLAARRIVLPRPEGTGTAYVLDPALSEVVARLERVFAADRLAIVRWMNARAIARVRDEAHKTFADAFLIRKKNPDG